MKKNWVVCAFSMESFRSMFQKFPVTVLSIAMMMVVKIRGNFVLKKMECAAFLIFCYQKYLKEEKAIKVVG